MEIRSFDMHLALKKLEKMADEENDIGRLKDKFMDWMRRFRQDFDLEEET